MPEDLDLLLTGDEIQALINRPLPATLAASIAVQATDAVRAYCGWRVAKSAAEVIVQTGSGTDRLFLPSLHVSEVTSVTVKTDDAVETLEVDEQYDWDFHGVLDRLGGRWPKRRRAVTVAIVHGYETTPGAIALAVAAAVARGSLAPAAGVTAESTLSASVTLSRRDGGVAADTIFLPHELAALDAYRVPTSR